jgi:hypothetical protein
MTLLEMAKVECESCGETLFGKTLVILCPWCLGGEKMQLLLRRTQRSTKNTAFLILRVRSALCVTVGAFQYHEEHKGAGPISCY